MHRFFAWKNKGCAQNDSAGAKAKASFQFPVSGFKLKTRSKSIALRLAGSLRVTFVQAEAKSSLKTKQVKRKCIDSSRGKNKGCAQNDRRRSNGKGIALRLAGSLRVTVQEQKQRHCPSTRRLAQGDIRTSRGKVQPKNQASQKKMHRFFAWKKQRLRSE